MVVENIDKIKEQLEKSFNNTSDLVLYKFNTPCNTKVMVVYIKELIDKSSLNDKLVKPLIEGIANPKEVSSTIPISEIERVYNIDNIIQPVLIGKIALFIEGIEEVYLFDLCFREKRTIEESKNERVITGSKEGFIEDINTNKSLIRRRIKNPNLVFEDYKLGTNTNTDISLVYLKDIVNLDILEEVKDRIKTLRLNNILDSSNIEHHIEDSPNAFVSTIGNTERPDVASGKILEGKVAIICDGSPNVLTIPKLFIENFQSPEDYYVRPQYSTYLRVLRIFAFLISIILPGFIVALKTFHHEMIPTRLLISMVSEREGVPFTALIEGLLMIGFFELMKESSMRIPGNIGPAVTTISGLILGQTAVQAGLVGPIMVITIATTGVAEFIIPAQRETIVFYRLLITLLGGILGLFGIICFLIIIIIHLVSIRTFGVPFMYPLAPYNRDVMKDFIYTRPIEKINYSSKYAGNKKERRK